MTTPEKLGLYQDALLRWLKAKRENTGLINDEPMARDYGIDDTLGELAKRQAILDFQRPVA